MHSVTNVPRLYWTWHSVVFRWQQQEDGMVYMVDLWWCHSSILRLGYHARFYRRLDEASWYCYMMTPAARNRPVSHASSCSSRTVEQLMSSCPVQATLIKYKESCLPSWSLLGTYTGCCAWIPIPTWLGVKEEGHRWMFSGAHYQKRHRPDTKSSTAVAEMGALYKGNMSKTALQRTALCHWSGLYLQN